MPTPKTKKKTSGTTKSRIVSKKITRSSTSTPKITTKTAKPSSKTAKPSSTKAVKTTSSLTPKITTKPSKPSSTKVAKTTSPQTPKITTKIPMLPRLPKFDLRTEERKLLLDSIQKNKVKINCDFQTALYWLGKRGSKLLGQGSYGTVFVGCHESNCNEKVAIKVITWDIDYAIDLKHPVNVEIQFLAAFNDLYMRGITPHVTLYYFNFECSPLKPNFTLRKLRGRKDPIKIWKHDLYKKLNPPPGFKPEILDKATILITELASGDLYNYLQDNDLNELEWRVILFQVMYMLVIAQFHLPGFRHNDLKPDNILVKTYTPMDNTYIHYKLFEDDYYIPDIGVRLQIWDFDFATCDSIHNVLHDNSSINYHYAFGSHRTANPVYDLHIFLNITFTYFDIKPKKIKTFFESNLPLDIRGIESDYTHYGRLTRNKVPNKTDPFDTNYIPPGLKTPAEFLLTHDFFIKFKTVPTKSTILMSYNSQVPKKIDIQDREDMFIL